VEVGKKFIKMHAGGASTGVGYMQDVCLAQGGGCFMVERIMPNTLDRPYPNTAFFVSFEVLSHPVKRRAK
jgi:hypothetical protein